MNLLEHYIQEIIGVEPCTDEWTKKFDRDFVKVRVKTNCYGTEEERETIVSKQEWEVAKERGYFMW